MMPKRPLAKAAAAKKKPAVKKTLAAKKAPAVKKKLAVKKKSAKHLTKSLMLREPQSNYMSDRQLEFFKNLLSEQHRDVHRILEDLQARIKDAQDKLRAADISDVASVHEEITLVEGMMEREQNLLRKIELALLSIENGNYGYCRETGQPIGIKRLLLSPTALYSVEAKARKEQEQGKYR